MKQLGTVAAVLAFGAAGVIAALIYWPLPRDAGIDTTLEGNAQRGAYIARVAGCIACHTDVSGGGAALAGGAPLKTPFGTFYAPNLTMDKEHGIGAWSLEQFASAVRRGVSPSGKPYYPAFPYPFYARMSDQDIADLWAAFNTVPPVAEASKDHQLGFPFSFRDGLKLWRAAFFDDQRFAPDPQRSDSWNRGAFLVEGPAHCGACHTPRNLAGGREAELAHHGAEGLPNGGKSPPITSQALKDAGWTEEDLSYALKTGLTPDGDSLGGLMGEVIRDGTSFMTDRDLAAMAEYLLNQPDQSDG